MIETNIKDVEEKALIILKEFGTVNPVIIFPSGTVLPLIYTDNSMKEMLLEVLRKRICDTKLDVYWQVSSGWSSSCIFSRPHDAVDKKTVLIISEFRRDGTSTGIIISYEYINGKLKIGKRKEMKNIRSRWNFFLEDTMDEQVTKDEINETMKMIDDTSLDKMYDIVKKQAPNVNITKEQIREVIHKMVKEGKIRPKPEAYLKYKKEERDKVDRNEGV